MENKESMTSTGHIPVANIEYSRKPVPDEVVRQIMGMLERGVNGERIAIMVSTNGDDVFIGSTSLWRVTS